MLLVAKRDTRRDEIVDFTIIVCIGVPEDEPLPLHKRDSEPLKVMARFRKVQTRRVSVVIDPNRRRDQCAVRTPDIYCHAHSIADVRPATYVTPANALRRYAVWRNAAMSSNRAASWLAAPVTRRG